METQRLRITAASPAPALARSVRGEIPLDQVPANIKKAAQAALPGLVLEEAERETEDGTVVYSLEGTADGEEYEVEVSAAGKVLEVERDDDDDDDDPDDDN